MMVDESKENSSPVEESQDVSVDDLVIPAKRMKLGSDAENGSTSSPEKEHSTSGEPSETAHSSPIDQNNDVHIDQDVITLSDTEATGENGSSGTTPSRESTNKKLKLTPAEKEERKKERLREMEERRIKNEELQAAKELRKKERAEQAHKKRIERENLAKEREEHRKLASEKKKAEEDLKKQKEKEREEQRKRAHEKKQAEDELKRVKEKEREQRKKEEEDKKEQKRKEDEEKRDKKKKELESEELRKKRASDHFMSFFSKVEKQNVENYGGDVEGPALPFEVKGGMVLAPIQRRRPLSPNSYSTILTNTAEEPYLSTLPRRTDKKRREMRSKLFQFHDNYRPPYYGTWRKRSKRIKGRHPFAKDNKIQDYNVDSDEEWEEEPEGEECDDENNRSDESECSDEENDGFLVEHGYLSDGEGSGNEEVHEDDEERRNRLHALAEDWKNSIKERTKPRKLIPKLYGPVFGETNTQTPAHLQPIFFFNYD